MISNWTSGNEDFNAFVDDEAVELRKDLDVVEKDLTEDLPDYSKVAEKVHNVWQFISFFRWGINFWVLGIPYTLIMISCMVYNVLFNTFVNKFWGVLNWWLIGNTIYMFVQGFLSIFLAFELPFWLKHFKLVRLISYQAAWWYTIFFGMSALEFWSVTHWENHDNDEMSAILWALALGYNLLVHLPIIPINLMIIIKESSMEFVQLGNDVAGTQDDQLSLGSSDLVQFLNLFNPLTWLDYLIWVPILGYRSEDYVIENPEDEEHYLLKK